MVYKNICRWCKKEFLTKKKNAKQCTNNCWQFWNKYKMSMKEHQELLHKICEFCKKPFEAITLKAKCCSIDCYKERYRKNNKELLIEKSKLWFETKKKENPEHIRKLWRKSNRKNKEYMYKYNKIYQENLRQEENKRRNKLGLPLIGEGYMSEMELFVYVSALFPNETIIRHDRSALNIFSDIRKNPELDIYLPNKKLAFEYDGDWHYKFHPYFHKTFDEFIERQKFHKLKRKMCKNQGITLIIVRESEKLSEQLVLKKLKEHNILTIQQNLVKCEI